MSAALLRMQQLSSDWTGRGDRRAIFADAYSTMTSGIVEAIRRGEFGDCAWVDRLLHRFADYYFDAIDLYDSGGECPLVWRHALGAAGAADLHPLQHLLLGINAHINYDLAFALADVLDDWDLLDPSRRSDRHSDHEAVNLIIGRTVDVVQAEVVEPLSPAMGLLDRLLGPFDEWLFSRLIAGWRDEVWHDAIDLVEAKTADRQQDVTERISERATGLADLIST
ncbi:MAG TPA: DUF5995 family protein [Acidimicrobiia bacterium]|nr:DUF5995 family protein [Acidimicrobiia bacterium]